jgi:YesN/AraC family two-component response regulator
MGARRGGHRLAVLIVDDEPGVRDAVQLLLGDRYDVVEASCGSEALDAVRTQRLDLVVLDVKLPDLDGISVLEQIRGEAPHIKVVMLTAIDAARTAVTAMKLGAIDYLTKPMLDDDLCEAVDRAFDIPVRRRETATDSVLVVSNNCGWRASLSALIAEQSGANVLTASLDRASISPDARVVVVDLIGDRSNDSTFVHDLTVSRRAANVVVWADDEQGSPSSHCGDDVVVVRGRRRIADLLRHVSRGTASSPRLLTLPTLKALHVVAGAYATTTVEGVASIVALSTRHLARVFRDDTGFTLKTYLLRVRLEAAKVLLRESDANLDTIAEEVGLYDASHMARLFRQFEGVRPSAYRIAGQGVSELS